MISSLDISKTNEILSRYRPIAPKPQLLPPPSSQTTLPPPPVLETSTVIHLQVRPSRSNKRTRASSIQPPTPNKRSKKHPHLNLLPTQPFSGSTATYGFSLFPFPPLDNNHHHNPTRPTCRGDLLTLPLLPPSPHMDLNSDPPPPPPLEEKNLLAKLQTSPAIIAPQPVRPVGSSISVGRIDDEPLIVAVAEESKKVEEVEEEVESEVMPAVVSDSNNRVRLVNSAYKKMVGQPECPWLDEMMRRSSSSNRRINGKVMLDLKGSLVPVSSKGFSCRVKIEWGDETQKSFVDAPCDVMRLCCESKDYLFTWRFHTCEAYDTNCEA
ncbi:hypothetical protein QJS04_geneDACA006236 [Acorus gramineus]|uniref:DUF7950 domain-containing protein n=1 Tax=Acorus gramineus TaxID=55184 RepID=A0AAV9AZ48_ACOGR|nr:hypothetical protein QJS04_geneDACA006236 [Acorus gramineus]